MTQVLNLTVREFQDRPRSKAGPHWAHVSVHTTGPFDLGTKGCRVGLRRSVCTHPATFLRESFFLFWFFIAQPGLQAQPGDLSRAKYGNSEILHQFQFPRAGQVIQTQPLRAWHEMGPWTVPQRHASPQFSGQVYASVPRLTALAAPRKADPPLPHTHTYPKLYAHCIPRATTHTHTPPSNNTNIMFAVARIAVATSARQVWARPCVNASGTSRKELHCTPTARGLLKGINPIL